MSNFAGLRGRTIVSLVVAFVLFDLGPRVHSQSSNPGETAAVLPTFSPDGGVFAENISLQLKSPAPGVVIRFTLDGAEPTAASPAYSRALDLRSSAVVRARAFDEKGNPGPVATRTFTLLGDDVRGFSSHLPIVIINTFGLAVEHVERLRASVRFIDAAKGHTTLAQTPDFDGRADLWYRGKSSLRYLKRSYGLKLRDDAGKAQSASVLGFPKDSDWILYAPYPDKSLVRDVVAYDLSRQMGHYASRTRFVEVFANEQGGKLSMRNYMGVFVLEEKIKRSTNRVNIAKLGTNDLTEPNITGGYLVKKDHGDEMRNVEPTWDGRPNFGGGNSGSRYGYPTGPGGFPADPRGFLPPVGGSREATRGWEDANVQPAPGGPRQQQESKSWIDGVRSFLGGERPAPERTERQPTVRRNDEPFPLVPGGPEGIPSDRSRRSVTRGNTMVWDARTGRAIISNSAEEVFYTSRRNELYYVEPDADEITPAQKNWLRAYFNEFERVLYGPNFRDPTNGYAAYVDPLSFIDHHLMVEVTKNIDGIRFSTYYSKDRGGKLKMEPIWDWNLSFGNANGKQGQYSEYWYWPQLDDSQYSYFRRLFEDPDFAQRYVDRYAELRAGIFSISNINACIDRHVAAIGEAHVRNFKRWPILGRRVWPNAFIGQTYEDEVNYMKDFTRKRLDWIDRQFVAAPVLASKAGTVAGLSAAAGSKIYYPLDGTDPRASGGAFSANAKEATGTFKLPDGARLVARTFYNGRWSAPVRR